MDAALKKVFKFQYDNTLSTFFSSSVDNPLKFKFQYDNTLRKQEQKLLCGWI